MAVIYTKYKPKIITIKNLILPELVKNIIEFNHKHVNEFKIIPCLVIVI